MNLPWCEKYRPKKLNNIYGNEFILDKIKQMLQYNVLRNMLFYGPPGTGKSSSVTCLKDILIKDYDIIHINASSDRSIDVIKTKINSFLKFVGKKKLVILDEFDNMLTNSQQLLVSLIDKYPKSLFILTCNNIDNILENVQDRCLMFEFNSLDKQDIHNGLLNIIKNENINYDDDGLKYLTKISNGDLRKAINYLQMIYFSYGKIDKSSVISLTDYSLYENCSKILKYCYNNKHSLAINLLMKLINLGYSSEDIIANLYDSSFELEITKYIEPVSNTYKNILNGYNSYLQIYSLIYSFKDLET